MMMHAAQKSNTSSIAYRYEWGKVIADTSLALLDPLQLRRDCFKELNL